MISEQIERELLELPAAERLRVARWLLDTLLMQNPSEMVKEAVVENDNPLLRIAGRFSGGPGDSAEQAEEILAAEVHPTHGLGKR